MHVRRSILLFALTSSAFVVGCSTHPVVSVCDYFQPGRLYPDKVTPYGGVCGVQRGTIQGTAPSVPFGMSVIPPPAPIAPSGPISIPTLPGPAPPGSVVPVPGSLPPPAPPPPPAFPTAPN